MMKYWNQLNELETAIYEVKSIQAGLNILCQTEEFTCYSPSGISQEHQTFVIDLNERFDTAMEKLNERFQRVWDTIRDDTGRLGAAEEDDEEFTNEDIAAINDLVKDHEASIRFDKILSNLPTMNSQDNYITAGAMDDCGITLGNLNEYFKMDFTFDPASENTLAIPDIKIDFQEDQEFNIVTPEILSEWENYYSSNTFHSNR